MIGKALLIIAVAFLAGIVSWIYFGSISISSISNHPVIENIKQNWTTYAPLAGGGFTLGIPLLNSAYKKMKANAQTKIDEAQTVATQASSELTLVKQNYSELETKYNKLINEGSSQALNEATTLVTQYKQQMHDMQLRHQGELSSLQVRLDKYEPKEVVVVK